MQLTTGEAQKKQVGRDTMGTGQRGEAEAAKPVCAEGTHGISGRSVIKTWEE